MKFLKLVLFAVVFGVTSSINAQSLNEFFSKADSFFSSHVANGRVDYKSIKSDPASLNELLDIAAGISVSKSETSEFQAFWINAYNIAVIKGIVEKYPVRSPLDIKGFFDKTKYEIGGKSTTLNDIENKILRTEFPKEARFHFVLVCAGLGCPPIIDGAYTPQKLESQLQRQTELALNNPNFIRTKGKKILLSQIFEWYKGDFTQFGSEIIYINKFREEPLPEKSKIGYYPYDWTLNEL